MASGMGDFVDSDVLRIPMPSNGLKYKCNPAKFKKKSNNVTFLKSQTLPNFNVGSACLYRSLSLMVRL